MRVLPAINPRLSIISLLLSAIRELLAVGSIKECNAAPTVVNPLSVSVQRSGKKRLILDLRYPNSYIQKSSVKFEDANSHTVCYLAWS